MFRTPGEWVRLRPIGHYGRCVKWQYFHRLKKRFPTCEFRLADDGYGEGRVRPMAIHEGSPVGYMPTGKRDWIASESLQGEGIA